MTDQANERQLDVLLETPFPDNVIGTLPKKGKKLSFIPYGYIVQRMNHVLGVGGWTFEVVDIRDAGSEIVAHVRVGLFREDGAVVWRAGLGGKVTDDRAAEGMSRPDMYKTAVSDAFKKAAQAFGVGLHLVIDEDEEFDAYSDSQHQPQYAPGQGDDDVVDEQWYNEFKAQVERLSAEGQAQVFAQWAELAGTGELGPSAMTNKVLEQLAPTVLGLLEAEIPPENADSA